MHCGRCPSVGMSTGWGTDEEVVAAGTCPDLSAKTDVLGSRHIPPGQDRGHRVIDYGTVWGRVYRSEHTSRHGRGNDAATGVTCS